MADRILQRFSLLKKKDRLAHAYLFAGAPGAGKTRAALAIAKMLNCRNPPLLTDEPFCGSCPVCRKIDAGNHPDLHLVQSAEGETLKIEQVREIIGQVKLRPFEASYKIFIIRTVEHLTREAANALLKTLEEPSPSSLLFLTSSAPENVLETIVSRCHMIKFFPVSQEELEVSLKARYNAAPSTGKSVSLSEHDIRFLAYMSEGCPGRAAKLVEDKWPSRKNVYIDGFLLSPHSEEFIGKIAGDKEKIKECLKVAMCWFRDTVVLKTHGDDRRLANADRLDDLEDFALRFTVEDLGALYRETVRAYKMVVDNLNAKLPLLILKEKLWAN